MSQSNNVRLLLKDHENVTHAVPVNDDLQVTSGIQAISLSRRMSDAQTTFKYSPQQEQVATVTQSGGERFFVARSIAEIFALAADAAKTGTPTVDLSQDSGEEAIVRKAAAAKNARRP